MLTEVQEESSKITTQATGATSWRRADVKYKKNEAFVDVVETVNLNMSAKGEFLSILAHIASFMIPQEPSFVLTLMAISKCVLIYLGHLNASSG